MIADQMDATIMIRRIAVASERTNFFANGISPAVFRDGRGLASGFGWNMPEYISR